MRLDGSGGHNADVSRGKKLGRLMRQNAISGVSACQTGFRTGTYWRKSGRCPQCPPQPKSPPSETAAVAQGQRNLAMIGTKGSNTFARSEQNAVVTAIFRIERHQPFPLSRLPVWPDAARLDCLGCGGAESA